MQLQWIVSKEVRLWSCFSLLIGVVTLVVVVVEASGGRKLEGEGKRGREGEWLQWKSGRVTARERKRKRLLLLRLQLVERAGQEDGGRNLSFGRYLNGGDWFWVVGFLPGLGVMVVVVVVVGRSMDWVEW